MSNNTIPATIFYVKSAGNTIGSVEAVDETDAIKKANKKFPGFGKGKLTVVASVPMTFSPEHAAHNAKLVPTVKGMLEVAASSKSSVDALGEVVIESNPAPMVAAAKETAKPAPAAKPVAKPKAATIPANNGERMPSATKPNVELVPTGATTPGLTHVEVVKPTAKPKPSTAPKGDPQPAVAPVSEANLNDKSVTQVAVKPSAKPTPKTAPKPSTPVATEPAKTEAAPAKPATEGLTGLAKWRAEQAAKKAAAAGNPAPATTPASAPAPKPKAAPAPKAEGEPKPKVAEVKTGLRKPQIRILLAMLAAPKPMTRKAIAEKAPVDQAACTELIGALDENVRKANDAKHFPSLLSLGLVSAEKVDQDGKDVILYSLTTKGTEIANQHKA